MNINLDMLQLAGFYICEFVGLAIGFYIGRNVYPKNK